VRSSKGDRQRGIRHAWSIRKLDESRSFAVRRPSLPCSGCVALGADVICPWPAALRVLSLGRRSRPCPAASGQNLNASSQHPPCPSVASIGGRAYRIAMVKNGQERGCSRPGHCPKETTQMHGATRWRRKRR
jgi:hypothetical protein